MSIDEQKELLSYCWRNNGDGIKYRCETIGIFDLVIGKEENGDICEISWSDHSGDPRIRDSFKNSDKIHKITNDGEWYHGLYKKKI